LKLLEILDDALPGPGSGVGRNPSQFVLPLIENGLVPGQNCWFYGNRETGFYQYFHHFFA